MGCGVGVARPAAEDEEGAEWALLKILTGQKSLSKDAPVEDRSHGLEYAHFVSRLFGTASSSALFRLEFVCLSLHFGYI